jgi:hypothetical protein
MKLATCSKCGADLNRIVPNDAQGITCFACDNPPTPRKENQMTSEQALPYVGLCVDDALDVRDINDMPDNARLVGWQCGFEPMFVAVWSYLDLELDDEEAEELATELLIERKWFGADRPRHADYVL